MQMTPRQAQILTTVASRNPDGSVIDLDQLLGQINNSGDRLVSKASLQFSIRSLIAYGCLIRTGFELRRGKTRRILDVTSIGRQMVSNYKPAKQDPHPGDLVETTTPV